MAKMRNLLEDAGRMFDSDETFFNKKFFHRNFKKILVTIILLMSYIQLRYEYENHLLEIDKLKNERNDVRYTSIEKWSVLTRRNRPEVIRQRVAQSSVELVESDDRPVILK